MKIVFCLVIALSTIFLAKAQTVIYDENAEVRKVAAFTGVEVSGTVSLYLSQGNETGVVVSAGEEKYNSKIKTEVVNGVLQISVDGGVWNTFSLANKKLKAYVSVKDLNRLEVSGASYATINGVLRTKTLQVNVSGASEVKGNIEVEKLHLGISGASVAKFAGAVQNGLIEASGACNIKSYDLVFENLKLNASGASQVRVTVNKELVADASGGSSVLYKGNAKSSGINASAGAKVARKNDNDN